MRREDLRAIEGLTEEQINEIMRLHGQDAATYQANLQSLQAQLTTALLKAQDPSSFRPPNRRIRCTSNHNKADRN